LNDEYENVIIGLEAHIQLTNLKTKLFCGCDADYRGKEPNSYTCPICLGLPGSLPVINKKVIEFAIRLALALGSKINDSSYFFRKNYFYPDLPKGYQISQYNKAGGKAFADGGKVTIKVNGEKKDIVLNRIHLEEDPARLVHLGSIVSSPYTLVDYNRSGIALIEVVSEPVMTSPEEAREYLKQIKSIVQYTGISDLDLEGSCRVDANISIKGHARNEIKNITSFREVEKALNWEFQRQKNLLKRGKEIQQETRHWDGRVTIPLRTKEFEKDYRYFPEQDLVPIGLDENYKEKVRENLPELPKDRAKRVQEQFKLSERDSEILILDKDIADFFEEGVVAEKSFDYEDYKQSFNWLLGDISAWLNYNNKRLKETKLTPKHLIEVVKSIKEGKITGKIAKTYIAEMMKGTSLSQIMKKSGKQKISDVNVITQVIKEVLNENADIIADYKKKNPKALESLIGKCMQKTNGQLDPVLTREIMLNLLK